MAAFSMVSNAKKIMLFCISVFEEAQGITIRGNLQGSKCDGDCIFLWELFSLYEKVPASFDSAGFFRNIFTPTPSDVFKWSSLVNNIQLY